MCHQRELLDVKKLQLRYHPIFLEVNSLPQLRSFMQNHVFAVWDFMTLVKRLQQDLSGTRVPWLPPSDPQAARLINEIVLSEESDNCPSDGYYSHIELYLEAMREIGACTAAIEHFICLLREGASVDVALSRIEIHPAVARFVRSTLDIAVHAPTHCVAAAFVHGRESVIPAMFKAFLDGCEGMHQQAPTLCYYLKRHIELDTHAHGPAAEQLLERLIHADAQHQQQACRAALGAVESRIALWNGLLQPRHTDRREVAL